MENNYTSSYTIPAAPLPDDPSSSSSLPPAQPSSQRVPGQPRAWPIESTQDSLKAIQTGWATKPERKAAKAFAEKLESWEVGKKKIEDQGWKIGHLDVWPKEAEMDLDDQKLEDDEGAEILEEGEVEGATDVERTPDEAEDTGEPSDEDAKEEEMINNGTA